MDEFCGSDFWDYDLTWNTTSPDFTPCFQQTVLIWIPSGFLLLGSIFDIYFSLQQRSKSKHVPRNPLNVSKIVLTLILILIHVVLLLDTILPQKNGKITTIYPADWLSFAVTMATYLYYLGLLSWSLKSGVQSSSVQFLFWLLLAISSGIRFRSLMHYNGTTLDISITPYVAKVIEFLVVLAMFFLNCWADMKPVPNKSESITEKEAKLLLGTKLYPEPYSSFLSKILFSWVTELVWKGYKKPLELPDIWELSPDMTSREVGVIFDKHWDIQLKKANAKKRFSQKVSYQRVPKSPTTDKNYLWEKLPHARILRTLIGAFGATFFFTAGVNLIPDILTFASPQILQLLIGFTSDPSEPLWKGLFYAGLLLVSALVTTLFTVQCMNRMFGLSINILASLTSAVYRKALVRSTSSKRESSTGEIVNLMAIDIHKVADTIRTMNRLWSAPLQLVIAVYFLWALLGPSSLAGLAVMLLIFPLNAMVESKILRLERQQLKLKDQRVKLMNEILSGIKVLKLYAWEPSFQDQVMKIRKEEVRVLRLIGYLTAVTMFMWACAPFLIALFTFTTYVLVDSENVLDAQVAFVSLSLFNILNNILTFIPITMASCVQSSVSVSRLSKYLNGEEMDPEAVTHDQNEKDPILIEEAIFSWEPEGNPVVLRDINLRVREGSFVAIVGSVGSGKSSLLAGILGEVEKLSGRVNTKGSIAYVAQQAWIQNATLKDNILFGSKMEHGKYEKVLDACALKPDLEILPAGDMTEIGEKGINLSGGQKQRVSLARAAYNNADVYLLDDPLSAVDAHVGKHIFDKVLGPQGFLRKKTRLLVTHGIQYLPQVDHIVVLKDGEVSEQGTYKELLERKGAFAEFLKQQLDLEAEEEQIEDDAFLEGETTPLEGIRRRVSRIRSGSRNSESDTEPTGGKRQFSRQLSSKSSRKLSQASMELPADKLIEEEQNETNSVKLSIYWDYFREGGWLLMSIIFFLYFFSQALIVGSNLFLSDFTSKSSTGTGNFTEDEDANWSKEAFLSIYGGLGLAMASCNFIAAVLVAIGSLRAATNLHLKMLQRILRAPLSFFDATPCGRILNRFSKDVFVCDDILPIGLQVWFNSIFMVLGTVFVICYSTPIFIAVFVPISGLYLLVQQFYIRTSRQVKRIESTTRSPIFSHFEETIQGVSTIRAFRQESRFIRDSEERVDTLQRSLYAGAAATRWLQIRMECLGNVLIFFAALFAVLGRDSLDPGLVGLSVSYAMTITMSLNALVYWSTNMENNIVSVERILEYAKVEQEADWETRKGKPKPGPEWPDKGEVQFDSYKTRYRPGLDLVLKGVTARVKPGEKIGIVGRTGAGKSSLTLALFRIIEPAGGAIVIDGKNISDLGLHDLRGRLTIIPQDPVLFSGSLRINLDPFEKETDEKIWKALELAHLKQFVQSLPAGLEHEVAEGGENLSVGQRQLVCLARAVLRKTKILVLDEATAAVDLETDDLIQETIRKEFKDSTVITIAHRLNTIMDSDRVMVLDKGEIREFNSPSRLLETKDSVFRGMAKDAGIH